MAETAFVRDWDQYQLTSVAAVGVGEIWQLPDGRAARFGGGKDGRTAGDASKRADFETSGKFTVPLTSGITILDGGRVYWDHSADAAHYKPVNDRDFYLGRAVGDSLSTSVVVDLNIDPPYDIDIARDPFSTIIVGTQALGGLAILRRGGTHKIVLSATNEAQKVDILSKAGFARTANAIVELVLNVIDDGAGTAVDVSLGVANATHATDADSITESLFVHLDANAVDILLESDDGTTEVAATDSTINYTMGDGLANQVHVWFDLRNEADIQVYINGANVLPATVFKLDAATGPLRLLAHVEKTASTDTYEIDVEALRVRYAEQ